MYLRPGSDVVVTTNDGSAFRGRVEWTWRWRTIRLVEASTVTASPVPIAGEVLIPHRSVLLVQEVSRGGRTRS